MEVGNVHQSPNFGMALRIKPEAVKTLREMTRAEVQKYRLIGEQLKDTKQYHLIVGEKGHRTIDSGFANKYAGGSVIIEKPNSELLKFNAIWEGPESQSLKKGDRFTSCIKFANKDAAIKAYEDILSSKYDYAEQDAKIVKYLDDAYIRKCEIENAERQEKAELTKMVEDLFDKYHA